MARAQSQFLRLYDAAGVTYQRWQSYYANTTVTWSNNKWDYVPFIANGFTAGIAGDETNVTISAPATSVVIKAFESAIKNGYLVTLSIYQFDTLLGNNAPQAGQEAIGHIVGQVIGGTGGLTSMTIQLGSALSPVGAQVPHRRFTTAIMGKGCRL